MKIFDENFIHFVLLLIVNCAECFQSKNQNDCVKKQRNDRKILKQKRNSIEFEKQIFVLLLHHEERH